MTDTPTTEEIAIATGREAQVAQAFDLGVVQLAADSQPTPK